jgi:hypothetical protein
MLHNILFIAMRWVMLVNSTTVPRTLLDPHLHERFHVDFSGPWLTLSSLFVRPILTTNVDQFLQLTGGPSPFSVRGFPSSHMTAFNCRDCENFSVVRFLQIDKKKVTCKKLAH